MKRLLALPLLAAVTLAPAAWAAPAVLRAPDLGWEVHYDAPRTVKLEEQSTSNTYHYLGNAGRFNLSLTIEAPRCEDPPLADDQVECFLHLIDQLPGLQKASINVARAPEAMVVSYATVNQVNGREVAMFHAHVLFADKGLWGDLHGSYVKPDEGEKTTLLTLGDGFYVRN